MQTSLESRIEKHLQARWEHVQKQGWAEAISQDLYFRVNRQSVRENFLLGLISVDGSWREADGSRIK